MPKAHIAGGYAGIVTRSGCPILFLFPAESHDGLWNVQLRPSPRLTCSTICQRCASAVNTGALANAGPTTPSKSTDVGSSPLGRSIVSIRSARVTECAEVSLSPGSPHLQRCEQGH